MAIRWWSEIVRLVVPSFVQIMLGGIVGYTDSGTFVFDGCKLDLGASVTSDVLYTRWYLGISAR